MSDASVRCRTALILSTDRGHDALLSAAAVVRAARDAGVGFSEVDPQLTGVDAFTIDIDIATVQPVEGVPPIDTQRVPPSSRRSAGLLQRQAKELLVVEGRASFGAGREGGVPSSEQSTGARPVRARVVTGPPNDDGARRHDHGRPYQSLE